MTGGATFQVQKRQCASCIYRTDGPWRWPLAAYEAACADPNMPGFFVAFRECHHAEPGSGVCCRGFWDRHKDRFAAGQLAQRLGLVEYVEVDSLRS